MRCRKLLFISLMLVYSGCVPTKPAYNYVPKSGQEIPATLQYMQAINQKEMVWLCSVNQQYVRGCKTPTVADNIAQNNILISPEINQIGFYFKTTHLNPLWVSVKLNAQSGEAYSLNLIPASFNPNSNLTAMYAGFTNFPTPTIQILNRAGQLVQAISFKPVKVPDYGGSRKCFGTCYKTDYQPVYLLPQ